MKTTIILVLLAISINMTYAQFNGFYPNDYDDDEHNHKAWCPYGIWLTVPGMLEWCTNNCKKKIF